MGSLFTGRNGQPAGPGDFIKLSEMLTAFASKRDAAALPMPQDFVNADQAPALATGAIDAQPALAALVAAGGGMVPRGTYRLDRPLVVDSVPLLGLGSGFATFALNFAAGAGVKLIGARPQLAGVTVKAAAARGTDPAIWVYRSNGSILHDIALTGPHGADGVLIEGANTTHLTTIDARPPTADPTGFAGGAALRLIGFAVDTHITGWNSAQWHYGMRFSDASGVFATAADNVLNGIGVLFDPDAAAGQQIVGAQLNEVLGDTSYAECVLFTGDGAITNVQTALLWASSSRTANGIAVNNPNLSALTLSGAHVQGNFAHGVDLLAGKIIDVIGGAVTDNSMAGPALWDGVSVGGTADQVRLIGVHSGAGGAYSRPAPGPGLADQQRFGINLGSAASGDTRRITVIGCQTPGNQTGYNLPTGARIVALGNTD